MQAGKIYSFDTAGLEVKLNDLVIVETNRGIELGKVVAGVREVTPEENAEPFKPVIRLATPDDISHAQQQRERAKKALAKSKELIASLNLPSTLYWA